MTDTVNSTRDFDAPSDRSAHPLSDRRDDRSTRGIHRPVTGGIRRPCIAVRAGLLLATVAVTATACGSAGGVLPATPTGPTSVRGGAPFSSTSPETPTLSPIPADGLSSNSLVGLTCADSNWTLDVIPAGGGTASARKFTLPTNVTPTFDCSSPPFALVQDFSHDFSKLAVNITATDSPQKHVGYVDTGTGELVDLDDSTATVNHSAPVFDPTTDELWYVDASAGGPTIARRPAVKGAPATTVGTVDAAFDLRFTVLATAQRALPFVEQAGLTRAPLPNPSGTVTALYDSTGGAGLGAQLSLVSTSDPDGSHGYLGDKLLALQGAQLPRTDMVPLTWIDDHTLITSADVPASANNTGANTYYRLEFSTNNRRLVRTTKLLMDASNSNGFPVVSPDKKRIAFRSNLNETPYLYVGSSSDIARLTPLTVDPMPSVLLGWF